MLAPILAGFLFEAGISIPMVAMIMALGSLAAAGALAFLKLAPDEHLEPAELDEEVPREV